MAIPNYNFSIEESFLRRIPECGVVAQYFYKVKEDEKEGTIGLAAYCNFSK